MGDHRLQRRRWRRRRCYALCREVASSSFYLSWSRVLPSTASNTFKIKRSIEYVYSRTYKVFVKQHFCGVSRKPHAVNVCIIYPKYLADHFDHWQSFPREKFSLNAFYVKLDPRKAKTTNFTLSLTKRKHRITTSPTINAHGSPIERTNLMIEMWPHIFWTPRV